MKSQHLLNIVAVAALLFFRPSARASTPEEAFWSWFQKNESSLFDFEENQEQTFNRLAIEMHKVNPDLTFEFGPKKNGGREFVISADGVRSAFPAVEALYKAAPKLPRWTFIKFRPRRSPADISYGGVAVKASSVRIKAAKNNGMVDLTIYIQGYTSEKHNTYASIAYLLLDQALGEYDVETRIGGISVEPPQNAAGSVCTLVELPGVVDSLTAHN